MAPDRSPLAVVVGAGPVGCVAAIVLANHGFEVTLVDRIRDPGSLSEQQTYMMAVNLRALKALRQAGITLPADVALPLEGSVFHFGGKTVCNDYPPEEEENVSAGRNELARFLITAAEDHASGRIRVLQGWTLYALEDEGDVARFRRTRQGEGAGKVAGDFVSEEMGNEEGEDRMDMMNYDLLLGADGVNSLVRSELVRFDKERKLPKKERFTFTQHTFKKMYKRLPPLSAAAGMRPPFRDHPACVHVWADRVSGAVIIAGPHADGRFFPVLITPETKKLRVEQLHEEDVVASLFESAFPQLYGAYLDDGVPLPRLLSAQPVGAVSVSTRCSRLHSGKVAVVGDAGHSMPPTLGQGLNAGLEDCAVLDDILASVPDLTDASAVRAALQEFTTRRKADVDAAVDMSDDPPLPGLARSWGSIGKGVIRVAVLTAAHRIVPSIPGPKRLNLRRNIPYSVAKKELEDETRLAIGIAAGTMLCLGAAVAAGAYFRTRALSSST